MPRTEADVWRNPIPGDRIKPDGGRREREVNHRFMGDKGLSMVQWVDVDDWRDVTLSTWMRYKRFSMVSRVAQPADRPEQERKP